MSSIPPGVARPPTARRQPPAFRQTEGLTRTAHAEAWSRVRTQRFTVLQAEPRGRVARRRFRRAASSFFCALFLGVVLAGVLYLKPRSAASDLGLGTFLLFLVLGLGAAAAAVLAVVYAIGGAIALFLDRHPRVRARLLAARVLLMTLVLSPFAAVPLFVAAKGIVLLEVPFLEGEIVQWSTEPFWFALAVCLWGVAGGLVYGLLHRMLGRGDGT